MTLVSAPSADVTDSGNMDQADACRHVEVKLSFLDDGVKCHRLVNFCGRHLDGVYLSILPQRENTLRPTLGVGGCFCRTKHSTAVSNSKRHWNPFKHGTVLISELQRQMD